MTTIEELQQTISFFASAIKSGEPWSDTCRARLEAARAIGSRETTSSPVSDFSRFRDLVTTSVEGTFEQDKEDALEELAEDLANVEVLAKVSYLLNTEGELHEYYDSVWGTKNG